MTDFRSMTQKDLEVMSLALSSFCCDTHGMINYRPAAIRTMAKVTPDFTDQVIHIVAALGVKELDVYLYRMGSIEGPLEGGQ